MTTTPPEAPTSSPSSQGPRVTREQLKDVTRLRRTTGSDRHIAGVSGGLARYFDIDPLLVRVVMVVLGIFGVGLVLYAALWVLLPEDDGGRALLDLDERSLAVALVVVVAMVASLLLGSHTEAAWVFGPILLVGLLVYSVFSSRGKPVDPSAPGAPVTWGGPGAADTPGAPGASGAPGAGDAPTAALPAYGSGPDQPHWTPPPVIRAPKPPDPRRRGPVLFWVTLALISLGVGILGLFDLSGTAVTPSAYAALALAVTGAMLLVGSFFGRAGGLILIGLVFALATAGLTVGEHVYDSQRVTVPAQVADVRSSYFTPAGEFTLDLTQVSDLARLDGRQITIDGGWSRVTVVVPDELATRVTASTEGPGQLDLFGDTSAGGLTVVRRHRVADPEASISLRIQLIAGDITVVTEGEQS